MQFVDKIEKQDIFFVKVIMIFKLCNFLYYGHFQKRYTLLWSKTKFDSRHDLSEIILLKTREYHGSLIFKMILGRINSFIAF